MRVLVTRPEPGATRTAARLAMAGYLPVVVPLTEIRAVPAVDGAWSGPFDAVAVTSANALRHAPSSLLESVRALPCFAVGGETAAIAGRAGFASVSEAGGDAASLADIVIAGTKAGASLLYLSGRIRRPEVEDKVRASGRSVAVIETYDTVAVAAAVDTVRKLAAIEPIGAVLVYSRLSADMLASMIGAEHPVRLEKAIFVAISGRAAKPLMERGLPVAIAASPDEDGLFAALRRES